MWKKLFNRKPNPPPAPMPPPPTKLPRYLASLIGVLAVLSVCCTTSVLSRFFRESKPAIPAERQNLNDASRFQEPIIEVETETLETTSTATTSPSDTPTATLLPSKTATPTATQSPSQTPSKTKEPTATQIPASATPTTPAGCPLGCLEEKPGCHIKGNISYNTGEKIYHVPGQAYYDKTEINPSTGERWFCTEAEAIANGWRKSKR